MEKIRLLLRSVYLKGHQDALTKTADMSWEDKIIKDIRALLKTKMPEELSYISAGNTTSGFIAGFNHYREEKQKAIDNL